jgi:hypothetical protein
MAGLLDQMRAGQYGLLSPNPQQQSMSQGLLSQPMPAQGTGLRGLFAGQGLAPYGMRHSGEGVKGLGYFGAIKAKDGHATEISSEGDFGEFPLLVPTLTQEEIELLVSGGEPTDDIYRKAEAYAATRRQAGQSPFSQPNELRYPMPSQWPPR